jgi:DNA repair protein RadC
MSRGARDEKGVYSVRVADLPLDERPRERLRHAGPAALTPAELLAIVLGSGTAGENVLSLSKRLLAEFRDLGGLAAASLADLKKIRGIGDAKALQLVAIVELARRINAVAPETRPFVRKPEDLAALLSPQMAHLEQEEMRLVLLDTRNRLVSIETMAMGSKNAAEIRPADLFREPLRQGVYSFALAHNHPTGDPTPSGQDIAFTQQVVEMGKQLQLELVDHVVIGGEGYCSLRERGLVKFD